MLFFTLIFLPVFSIFYLHACSLLSHFSYHHCLLPCFHVIVLLCDPWFLQVLMTWRLYVRICSHGSNTTWNSSEFPRYVYLLIIQFPETPDFPMFSISGNSGLRHFPRFLYYVITLISCLHLSLVTPSAVVSTSLSLDPQFPFALLYCFRLCNSDPLLCTQYKLVPFLSYKYLYSVPR